MRTNNGTMAALVVIALSAEWGVGADAPVSAVSEEGSLNTRSLSVVTTADDQDLDTRSHMEAWSSPGRLSTKAIKGTLVIFR